MDSNRDAVLHVRLLAPDAWINARRVDIGFQATDIEMLSLTMFTELTGMQSEKMVRLVTTLVSRG